MKKIEIDGVTGIESEGEMAMLEIVSLSIVELCEIRTCVLSLLFFSFLHTASFFHLLYFAGAA